MGEALPASDLSPSVVARRNELVEAQWREVQTRTDRLFGLVMIVQYVGGVATAAMLSPHILDHGGATHPHIRLAAIVGLLIAAPVWVLAWLVPGRDANRYVIAIAQMLMSGLLIHVSGGRMETHFHVFGSLAFLGFYRDWKVLVPAVLVVLADHAIRGYYVPMSVYGLPTGAEWRFLEHAGWIMFCTIFIGRAAEQGRREMYTLAERQAQLEDTKAKVEGLVIERTHDLRESEARKSAILASAIDGILSVDLAGRVIEMNPSAHTMFGIPTDSTQELLVDNLLKLEPEHGKMREVLEAIQGRSDGMGVHMEGAGLRPDGEFPLELSVSPVHVYGQISFTLLVRDVSDKRRLEAKVAHGEKMETLGRLATGIAHEINTPNQFIADNVRFLRDAFSGLCELVQSYRRAIGSVPKGAISEESLREINEAEAKNDIDFLVNEIPHAAKEALEGVDRVRGIVKAMRQFSHPGTLRKEPLNVNAVVSGAMAVSRNEWKNAARLEVDLDEEVAPVLGHAGDLGQAMLNLIVNASHAVADKYEESQLGVLKISTWSDGDHVCISVEDDGCGIPQKNLAKIFDPFFTTKGVGLGTGQGLPLVHRAVVEGMNGDIQVDSEIGRGTRFVLRFPAAKVEVKH